MTQKIFNSGEQICSENSPGTEMYVIRKGKVRVYKTINGEKIDLGFIKQNNMFGELSLFLDSHRTASIEAVEDTEVLILKKDELLTEIKNDPSFAVMLLTKMAHRVEDAHKIIAKLQGEVKSLEIMHR